jgi:hypothetical protein
MVQREERGEESVERLRNDGLTEGDLNGRVIHRCSGLLTQSKKLIISFRKEDYGGKARGKENSQKTKT